MKSTVAVHMKSIVAVHMKSTFAVHMKGTVAVHMKSIVAMHMKSTVAVYMRNTIFWDVTPCSLVKTHRHFRDTTSGFRVDNISAAQITIRVVSSCLACCPLLKMETVFHSETSVIFVESKGF
jgi:hypothetical protein